MVLGRGSTPKPTARDYPLENCTATEEAKRSPFFPFSTEEHDKKNASKAVAPTASPHEKYARARLTERIDLPMRMAEEPLPETDEETRANNQVAPPED